MLAQAYMLAQAWRRIYFHACARISACGSMEAMKQEGKKDPGAVAMAKKRAESLTPERRSEIAAAAAAKRWGAKKKKAKK